MNKKFLFAAMSFAALTACTTDDFESQKVAEEVSPVQFEVINNNAQTRASMDGNDIVWNANDGDLFTLYFGAEADQVKGFENACYKAEYGEEKATLSTPTMIKAGRAIMVWPVDTTFRIKTGDDLTLTIPTTLKAKDKETGKGGVENAIPYVSDLINIDAYDEAAPYNTAGKDRVYPVYMRPMASQLHLKAIWDGMDKIEALTKLADDAIEPITLTSVKLQTKEAGTTKFTSVLPIKWTNPSTTIQDQWDNAHTNRAWEKVTDFNVATATGVAELTTECIVGTELAEFLILPQANIAAATGVDEAAIVLNTYYGQVVIQNPAVAGTKSKYNATEYANAWYRYLSSRKTVADDNENESDATATSSSDAAINGKFKTVAKGVHMGMRQTIDFFSTYKAKDGVVKDEPKGTATTRYVNVLLKYLDMSDLHIKSDKQLRDVVRVWKALNLAGVTVFLDDDAAGTEADFCISQKTIEEINNANKDKEFAKWFKVKPCQEAGEKTNKIIITDGGEVPNIAFIAANGAFKADVELANETTAWQWKGTVKVEDDGVNQIINKGKMENEATATLATAKNSGVDPQNNVPFVNDGTWEISAGATVNVQFDVTNNGTLTIAKTGEYRQDGRLNGANTPTIFRNRATTLPARFLDDPDEEAVGKVINEGVFATVASGEIRNYGLIKHADKDAKTYITTNQTSGAKFTKYFYPGPNKMGMIELPYDNKDENNISISAAANEGFVAVTVDAETAAKANLGTELNNTAVGTFVNYIIINGGIETITNLDTKIKYVEIADKTKEIVWQLDPEKPAPSYDGLMVLSNVNITLGTTINVTKATYLHKKATMYVGGTFNNAGWNGYYGNTEANVATNYVTF